MKIAALDLGSNTSLMLIAEVEDQNVSKVYQDKLTFTRLGQGLSKNKSFHPDALARMEECFKNYREIIEFEKVDKIVAMATSAARDAENGDELFKLGEKYGIPIEIITGSQEAEVTFKGATYEYDNSEGLVVVDVGGGSTEVIGQYGGKIKGHSVDVGSVRLTEMFGEDLDQLASHIQSEFEKHKSVLPSEGINQVLAVAGTPTTISAIIQEKPYSSELVHGSKLSKSILNDWLLKLKEVPLEQRRQVVGMDRDRADVILAGLSILIGSMNALGVNEVTVSDRGVRFGVALLAENIN